MTKSDRLLAHQISMDSYFIKGTFIVQIVIQRVIRRLELPATECQDAA